MINWLTALKILPWKDMIEYAPTVVGGAQKLWQRVRTDRQELPPESAAIDRPPLTADEATAEIGELKRHAQELQARQLELSNLLKEIADQNQRLIQAIDVLRLRTRILLWGFGGAVCAAALFAWRASS